MTKQEAVALINLGQKTQVAKLSSRRASTRQRLELVEVFAEVRGAAGAAFRGETFYGPSIHQIDTDRS